MKYNYKVLPAGPRCKLLVEWRYALASVPGTSHVEVNVPCQDCCLVKELPCLGGNMILLAIVADGAGSAALAQVGSRLACDTLAGAIAPWIENNRPEAITREVVLDRWLREGVLPAFEMQAKLTESRLRDLATTLVATIVTDDIIYCFQIGDGALVFSSGADYQVALWPQNGEYANTTNFLTDSNMPESLRFLAIDATVDEVALFSDGLQMLALNYESQTAHQPFFNPMFSRLRIEGPGESPLCLDLEEFLSSKSVNSRTDDDKTLILATRRG